MVTLCIVSEDSNWLARFRGSFDSACITILPLSALSQLEAVLSMHEVDVVVIDCSLLPAPESDVMNWAYEMLGGTNVIGVYTPGPNIGPEQVRRSFIVGASRFVPKYDAAECVRTVLKSKKRPELFGVCARKVLHANV